ncbi:MAG: hypothetical protein EA380_05005 [Phycisphaeraceae bacterium]|nr:MAG: hypothetical protein EA380_05005 [Phycisphaeraceae bacterium]TVS04831.1 MAG: hypothetical protein EA423_07220 [Phycisphaerales bacterium]
MLLRRTPVPVRGGLRRMLGRHGAWPPPLVIIARQAPGLPLGVRHLRLGLDREAVLLGDTGIRILVVSMPTDTPDRGAAEPGIRFFRSTEPGRFAMDCPRFRWAARAEKIVQVEPKESCKRGDNPVFDTAAIEVQW